MGFENFRLNVAREGRGCCSRLIALAAWSATQHRVAGHADRLRRFSPSCCCVELVRYVESVNREFAEFLSFVAHDDFAASPPLARKGGVFRELESAYRLLAGKYRSLNLQRAANHQYLEALVEHVSVALICLDGNGAVTLMNREAKALFKTPHLASLKSFARIDPAASGRDRGARRRRPRADQRQERGRGAAARVVRDRVRAARRALQADLLPEHPRRARAARDRLLAEADQGAHARDHELRDADHLADQAHPRPAGGREDRRAGGAGPRERRADTISRAASPRSTRAAAGCSSSSRPTAC